MTFGLIQFGALPSSPAYAADLQHRAGLSITAQAARDFQVSNARPAAPVENAAEAREQARRQVMAERGVDTVAMFNMSAQGRMQAEIAIMVETARRIPAEPVRTIGNLVDLRI